MSEPPEGLNEVFKCYTSPFSFSSIRPIKQRFLLMQDVDQEPPMVRRSGRLIVYKDNSPMPLIGFAASTPGAIRSGKGFKTVIKRKLPKTATTPRPTKKIKISKSIPGHRLPLHQYSQG